MSQINIFYIAQQYIDLIEHARETEMWYLSGVAALLTILSTMWQEFADNVRENRFPPLDDDG